MKPFFYIISSLLIVCSCSNGLNKPITEELSQKELTKNIKRYPFFEEEYPRWENTASWLLYVDEQFDKYCDVTYKDLVYCTKNRPSVEELDLKHKALFPQRETLREKADSIVKHYSSMRPDSLVSLEFVSIRTYRSLIGWNSDFVFLAKPLKEGVEQFRFEFGFAKKIDGLKDLSEVSRLYKGSGESTTPLLSERTVKGNPSVLYYGLNETTEELKRDFDFFYKITDVRFRGENWRDAPFAINMPSFHGDALLDLVIFDCIDENFLPFEDFKNEEWEKFYNQYNPTVADFMGAIRLHGEDDD